MTLNITTLNNIIRDTQHNDAQYNELQHNITA